MSTLSTHILDTAIGLPAEGVSVSLSHLDDNSKSWKNITSGTTNSDGRIAFGEDLQCESGTYKLSFAVDAYQKKQGGKSFYPEVDIVFAIDAQELSHYHVPLLLNPYGYSTYRGS